MHAPSVIVHGVGLTTGGGGGGGGVSDDEDGGGGADEEDAGEDEDGGAGGVSACTAPCAHPATDTNATAKSSIRIPHPRARPSLAEVDGGRITEVATARARLPRRSGDGPSECGYRVTGRPRSS
ncbi:hypothetical protein GCM10017774_88740 [Lentzea cavernae]|uniref:Uncharacterized protein n=1 Tax=Lentzea cavernae TaxID=2020703 RepID=A0ABQ3MVT0_9PSEU|nr:hypothetical protein GCM10017774_88740 [Lentzea cavernae]